MQLNNKDILKVLLEGTKGHPLTAKLAQVPSVANLPTAKMPTYAPDRLSSNVEDKRGEINLMTLLKMYSDAVE